jgi:hypothetical protein
MDTQDPALSQEAVIDGNGSLPPGEENKVESEELDSSEEKATAEDPQDDQDAETEPEQTPEPEYELLIDGEARSPEKEAAPDWVKKLRKEQRELKARNAELERALQAQQPAQPVLGAKPTLEDCEFDPDEFSKQLEEWHSRKQEISAKEAEARAGQEKQAQAWNAKVQRYYRSMNDLSKQIPAADEAVKTVEATLNHDQQRVIVGVAKNPALVIVALGQDPSRAQDLASETDILQFAAKIGSLEATLKMAKKSAPQPEKPVRGTGPVSGSVDHHLERLRAEADRTGDYTKVIEYKAKKRPNN